MRISDWSSDVCSSDLSARADRRADCAWRRRPVRSQQRCARVARQHHQVPQASARPTAADASRPSRAALYRPDVRHSDETRRSEEHTSELQSLMRISYAVFCLKNKKKRYTADNATKEPHMQTSSSAKK